MSFCRITGRSRGLPKPNYFPLLPPISPADAKRFCRITSKSYGLPNHHYTPVVLVRKTDRRGACHITTKAEGQPTHHFMAGYEGDYKPHVVSKNRYMYPILDSSSLAQKLLTDVLERKNGVSTPRDRYVYTVEEQCCSLVIPANLEAAVRDGDVRSMMIAKDYNTMLLQLRQGREVTLDMKDVVMEEVDLWEGKGPTEEAQNMWEMEDDTAKKRKKKSTGGLKLVTQFFEEKDRVTEMRKMGKVLKDDASIVKINSRDIVTENLVETKEAGSKACLNAKTMSWANFVPDSKRANTSLYVDHGNWRDLVEPLVESWDCEAVENEISKLPGVPTITKLPTPIVTSIDNIDLSLSLPGLVLQQPVGTPEEIAGFELVPAVVPFIPLMEQPEDEIQVAIQNISKELLGKTAGVREVLSTTDTPYILPTSQEVQVIMENLEKGHEMHISGKDKGCIHGLVLDISAAKIFVPGQAVETAHGKVFVPGQTVQTFSGAKFVPGITVGTSDGPRLIPGQKVFTDDYNGMTQIPVFVAGQNLTTRNGEKFVAGQTVQTPEGPKFVTGQTVYTNEGPKFVAGQIVAEKDVFRFVPGQTVMTDEGPEFIFGQTITTHRGNIVFIPGINVKENEAWEFVPGQVVKSNTAQVEFVPGRTLVTGKGTRFIPGRIVMDESKHTHTFLPGVTVNDECKLKRFVPGKVVDTIKGPLFLEGQIVEAESSKLFIPGKTCFADDKSVFNFSMAKCLTDAIVKEIDLDVPIIDPSSLKVLSNECKNRRIFGHMVQSAHGVEFFAGLTEGLPAGKLVPGELLRSEDGEIQFVPGIISSNGKFIPGQIVFTEDGEQFVPGQVVDTKDGLKFVPGQVVDTHSGPKFVPGQTLTTPDGPRFVPGQIVETKAGFTFIPGQVISTENEGSRFVPGQVINTAKGPHFVPGRVVETSDRVTFVPGQVVITDEGPHFVAPDLQNSETGELEFFVQGFEVIPEELKLLQSHTEIDPCFTKSKEMAIDSKMLMQLSEAGMPVGGEVQASIPAVNINNTVTETAMEIAHIISDHLGLKEISAIKLGEVVSVVAHIGSEMLDRIEPDKCRSVGTNIRSEIEVSGSVEDVAQALVHSVVIKAKEQCIICKEDLILIIETVFEDILSNAINVRLSVECREVESLVDSLHSFIVTPGNVDAICDKLICENTTKTDFINSVLREGPNNSAVGKLMAWFQNGNPMVDLSRVVPKSRPKTSDALVHKVIKKDNLSEQCVVTSIQRAVMSAIQEVSEQCFLDIIKKVDKNYLLQAVSLAETLGMADTTAKLLEALSDPQSSRVLYEDPFVSNLLRSLAVIRRLTEDRHGFISALEHLQSDRNSAALDPIVRQLILESAALIGLAAEEEELPLESSDDIPSILFQNPQAMKEFIRSRKHYGPLLILKHGLQAVVPREAARAVLTGQIAYSVLDEKGMRRFEPMHVLSALRLPQLASDWFPTYSGPLEEPSLEFTATTTSSVTPTSGSLEDLSQDLTTSGTR